jgi:hypothetical protein
VKRFLMHLQLGLLRGREQTLHNQIAQGYFRGDYQAVARQRQQTVRREIHRLEQELDR